MCKLFTALLFIISTSIYAQDQVAEDILDNLRRSTESYKNIIIDFDLIIENKSQSIYNKQTGRLESEKNKFRLTIANQTITNDGESQWVYLSDMNEVHILEHNPEDNTINPNKLFSIYKDEYKHKYIGTKSEDRKILQIIDLFPKESNAFIKITLSVDSTINQLERITIHDKNGGTYTYIVKSFKGNTLIQPFIFNTTDFPGIEVIDLR